MKPALSSLLASASRRRVLATLVVLACGLAASAPAAAQAGADALRARHAALADKLAANAYKRPLYLESAQASDNQRGEVFVEVGYPFAVIKRSMQTASQWCDILALHLNVKRCQAEGTAAHTTMSLSLGKKADDYTEDASSVTFDYRVVANTRGYLQVTMNAPEGPLGTRDYRIALEAIPLDGEKSFLHMSYSYGYGFAARLAMQVYLSTVGADKVGFSVVGKGPDGKPILAKGIRGVVERNTMRYYLAIEAYLGSLALPRAEQTNKRIRDWFAATEEFAPQLHELSESDYVQMKQRQLQP